VRLHYLKRLHTLCVAATLFGLGVQTPLFAQSNAAGVSAMQPPPVRMSFIVTDNRNHFVDGLRKEDIKVFADKEEQPLVLFERDERPIHYAIAIDTSGSFRQLLSAELEAVSVIIKNNRDTDDLFIERFVSSDKIEKLRDFTNDQNALLASLKRARIEGGQSAVLDALYVAVNYTASRAPKDDRKAVIIITDGEDRSSFYGLEKVVGLLHETKVPVFVIGMVFMLDDTSGLIRESPRVRAESLLTTVAAESGGRLFLVKNLSDLATAVREIVHDVRSQYLVAFQSTRTKESQKIEIKIVEAAGREGWKTHHIPAIFPPSKQDSMTKDKARP